MRKFLRGLELAVLFVVLPALFPAGVLCLRRGYVILLLAALGVACLTALLADPLFDRRSLWKYSAARRELGRISALFWASCVILAALVALFRPELLLSFVKEAPWIWATVMLLYPVLSVYPQELVFRTFFFHRYRYLLPTPPLRVGASACLFGYAHVIFENWAAVALSLVGGLLFSATYERTRSTFAACLEHTLYGWLILTVGLGRYFYHGAVAP